MYSASSACRGHGSYISVWLLVGKRQALHRVQVIRQTRNRRVIDDICHWQRTEYLFHRRNARELFLLVDYSTNCCVNDFLRAEFGVRRLRCRARPKYCID